MAQLARNARRPRATDPRASNKIGHAPDSFGTTTPMDESSQPKKESADAGEPRLTLKTSTTPRRDRTYLDAFEPRTCEVVPSSVAVTLARATHLSKAGKGKVIEITSTVAETLSWPVAVYSGLRCDDDERCSDTAGWRCYVGRPQRRVRSDGLAAEADPNDVFLVFVNIDGVAYNWRWEAASPDNLRLPSNHASRFRQREYFEQTNS